jgi:aryl-alcohol dehydrogenase
MSGRPAYCEIFMQRNLRGTGLDPRPIITDSHGAPVAARWFGQSSFATHAVVAARNVIAVDKQLPIELLGPLGCGVQTRAGAVLVALDVRAGSSIVVFGAGGVGLSAIMAAKLAGASTIVAVDLHENRLALASELGATHTFVGTEEHLAARIRAVTDGGAHFALDTTGLASVAVVALKSPSCPPVHHRRQRRARRPPIRTESPSRRRYRSLQPITTRLPEPTSAPMAASTPRRTSPQTQSPQHGRRC